MSEDEIRVVAEAMSATMFVNDYGEWVLPKNVDIDDIARAAIEALDKHRREDAIGRAQRFMYEAMTNVPMTTQQQMAASLPDDTLGGPNRPFQLGHPMKGD